MKKLLLSIAFVALSLSTMAQQRTERVEYQESSAHNIEPEQAVMIGIIRVVG